MDMDTDTRDLEGVGGADDADGGLTVGQVSRMLGVSVRTLHHWDAIGLASPRERTWADYRIYTPDDVARLHEILVYRRLGFALAEISEILGASGPDTAARLRKQRALLEERMADLATSVAAVDALLEVYEMNDDVTENDLVEIFGDDYRAEYQEEAKERWGSTPQWAESQRRSTKMSKDEWRGVKERSDALEADLAAACREGVAPDSDEARALAERHRESIGEFYECTHSMQVLLGRMYTQDPRFTEHYDRREPGLAAWLSAAIDASARHHGVDPESACWE